MNYHMPSKRCGKITNPFPNVNRYTVEVWVWISSPVEITRIFQKYFTGTGALVLCYEAFFSKLWWRDRPV